MGEEHRLNVFENKMPMKIFGHLRNEVTGVRVKLHNDWHRDSSDIVKVSKWRRIGWGGTCCTDGKGEKRMHDFDR
jgi:hypothetical protein